MGRAGAGAMRNDCIAAKQNKSNLKWTDKQHVLGFQCLKTGAVHLVHGSPMLLLNLLKGSAAVIVFKLT